MRSVERDNVITMCVGFCGEAISLSKADLKFVCAVDISCTQITDSVSSLIDVLDCYQSLFFM